MKHNSHWLGVGVISGVAGFVLSLTPAMAPSASPSGERGKQQRAVEAYGQLPLYFIENQGQLDTRVAYYIQGRDKSIYFTLAGVTYVLMGAPDQKGLPEVTSPAGSQAHVHLASFGGTRSASEREDMPAERWAVKLDFVGANPDVEPLGQDPTDAVVSYFKGRREEWKVGLGTYASLVYEDLWPGIDLVYRGTVNRLKYTFLVHPGPDPQQIRLAYRGAEVSLNEAGQLQVATPVGGFEDDKPYAYQEDDGQREEVMAAYVLKGEGGGEGQVYGFRVGAYNHSLPLVIDPAVLVYAGYIGGLYGDSGTGIAVDSAGNAYITGATYSMEASFPVTVGPDLTFNRVGVVLTTDAFVAKVNPGGTALVYAGYIGGDGWDFGDGIAVDGAGNAYVIGTTGIRGPGEPGSTEASFPVTVGPDLSSNGPNFFRDAFVAKVNPGGTVLVYAGYIGGADDDTGSGIAVDGAGNAYVTGVTGSTEASFPVTVGPDLTFNGGADVFVAKVNPGGTALAYAGYIGGAGDDFGNGIAIDGAGNAYVTGRTGSTEASFPVTVGPDLTFNGGVDVFITDAFVAKVNAGGTALVYAGYIGGAGYDTGSGIAVDGAGNAYVIGDTGVVGVPKSGSTEATFPVTVGPDLTFNGGTDAFVAKVNPGGTALVYAGYIGGDDLDYGFGIAVDRDGNAYVTGETYSTEASFPVTVGPDLSHNGPGFPFGCDAFVAKIATPEGPLVTGVFDAAGFQELTSPGSIVSVFGSFAERTARATTIPLSMKLDGLSVSFNGIPGALFGVFGDDFGLGFNQANVQVPWELDISSGTVELRVHWERDDGEVWSEPFSVDAALASPGMFTFQFGPGQAIVTNFSLGNDDVIPGSFAQPEGFLPGVSGQPAAVGGVITVWCNGLGPVSLPPPTGDVPGAGNPLQETTKIVRLLIGGIEARVIDQPVLHPTLVGLNQINAFVPQGVTPGGAVPIVIEVDCGDGNVFRSRADVTIAVRPTP